MSDEAKYHHMVPKTYLKPWYHNTQSIWVYQNMGFQERNVETVFGENYYHGIKAGSLYTNAKALGYIFGFLWKYIITYEGRIVRSKAKLNQFYFDFDKWNIKKWFRREITRKERNVIKARLAQSVFNGIEEEWNRQYENDWSTFIQTTENILEGIQSGKPLMLTTKERRMILRYFVMFDWRGEHGKQWVNDLLARLLENYEDVEIPLAERTYKKDDTLYKEQKHAIYIRLYDQFLHKKGAMFKEYQAYCKQCTLMFWLAPNGNFITSNNPCYRYVNELGQETPTFIALPNLAITLVKKNYEEPNAYRICVLNDRQVEYFNYQTMKNGTRMVFKEKGDVPTDVGSIFDECDGKIILIP